MKKILLSTFIFLNINASKFNIQNLRNKKNLIEFAVIGSGPAGLSACIYAARSGFLTVCFTGPKPGGQLHDSIIVENMPGVDKATGAEVMSKLENQTKSFGALLIPETIIDVDLSSWPYKLIGQNDIYYVMTLVIATGATPRRLNIKGESNYWLKEILACAVCDAELAKNKHVVVIGGGDSAISRILQLLPYAKSLDVIVRSNKLRASPAMLRKLNELDNVNIIYNSEVTEFVGDKNLKGVTVRNLKTKASKFIDTNLVFVAAGFIPNTDLFKKQLPLTQQRYIKHNKFTQETCVKGIYVAGNAGDYRYRLASTAAGDATKAAMQAGKILHNLPITKDFKQEIKRNFYIPKDQGKVTEINSEKQFYDIISNNKKSVVMTFYSPLCSTCQYVDALLSTMVSGYSKNFDFYKIERSKFEKLAKKYNVEVIPEILIFNKSNVIKKFSDNITKKAIIKVLSSINLSK